MNIDEFRTIDNFDNDAILKNKWDEVDELLSTFYTKNQKLNKRLYDDLQDVFDWIKFSYSELDNYASSSDIARLRRKIDEVKDEYGLEEYIGYELSRYASRKKLKNKDILLALIKIQYYKQYKKQRNEEQTLFDEIKNVTYKQTYKETRIILNKPVPKKEPEMPRVDWIGILYMLGYNGFNWQDYIVGVTSYNANKLYELLIINIQQGKPLNIEENSIKKLLIKQQKAYLNKVISDEVHKGYKDDFSGSLDNQISFLVNQISLVAMKKAGCTKVKFVAVLDENTTKMCKSLDGQIFNIYRMNKYERYSDADKKVITYKTFGLEVGANLPPILNHYHYCRSTIHPVK